MKTLKDEYPEEFKRAMKETRQCQLVERLFETGPGICRDGAWALLSAYRSESYVQELRQRLKATKKKRKG